MSDYFAGWRRWLYSEEAPTDIDSRRYKVIVIHKKGWFYLRISELALVATSESIESGYRDLMDQKAKLFERYKDCEAECEIPLPGYRVFTAGRPLDRLRMFTAKTLICCCLVGLTITVSVGMLSYRIGQVSVGRVGKGVVKSLLSQIESIVVTAPEEQKKRHLLRLREILKQIEPFARESKVLFPPGGHSN